MPYIWLAKSSDDRILVVEKRITGSRVTVKVHDSGPGIEDGDEETIFYPGVTRKPDGLGMGLTVASELVSRAGGELRLAKPGAEDGASFEFNLPFVEEPK